MWRGARGRNGVLRRVRERDDLVIGRGEAADLRAARGACAILWDVDGVIIDSGEQHRRAWAAMAAEYSLPYSDADFWATFGMRNQDIIPQVFGVRAPDQAAAMADRKEELYRELLRREAVALPGARELMAALHAAGYHQALGSSAPVANIEAIIELLGIRPWLDGYLSGERVANGKPAPDIFLAGAALLGADPARCLVIEDAPAGIQAARAGGMRCVAVRRAGQDGAPGLEAADRVVDSLLALDVVAVDALLGVSG